MEDLIKCMRQDVQVLQNFNKEYQKEVKIQKVLASNTLKALKSMKEELEKFIIE